MTEKKLKIKINQQKCIGCGACSIIAPEAFYLDTEKGKATVKDGVEKTDFEKIKEASEYCPVYAIEIEQ